MPTSNTLWSSWIFKHVANSTMYIAPKHYLLLEILKRTLQNFSENLEDILGTVVVNEEVILIPQQNVNLCIRIVLEFIWWYSTKNVHLISTRKLVMFMPWFYNVCPLLYHLISPPFIYIAIYFGMCTSCVMHVTFHQPIKN